MQCEPMRQIMSGRTLLLLLIAVSVAGCGGSSESEAMAAMGPPPQGQHTWKSVESLEDAALGKDVPYVPTRMATVEEMLRLANVTGDDVVFDLGCGDGRIVIAAAEKYGARGVGIDIDPVRIGEAEAYAKKAGVTDKVRFIRGDLFQADLTEATVVTLYLLPSVNVRLRPKLLDELRPGTPVVSHDFDMAEWKPDVQTTIDTDDLFLWIIPAKVEGTWSWTSQNGQARRVELMQEFQKFRGRGQGLTVSNGVLNGDVIMFELAREGAARPFERYSGMVEGDTIRGTIQLADGTSMPWVARHE